MNIIFGVEEKRIGQGKWVSRGYYGMPTLS
jgi:hypothetical protein